MAFITDPYAFLLSVMLISLSGVLMPGPLFAVTIQQASKSKIAGILIALGHGIVEFPLMFVIFFILSQFEIPMTVQVAVGLIGGFLMVLMGIRTFRSRNKAQTVTSPLKRDSLLAGVWTTAVNAGFILWWITIGTALILNASFFGMLGFSVFAVVHWLCDFSWYAIVGLLIFKSQRFWSDRTRVWTTLFCVVVFIGFGLFFMGSAILSLISTVI